MKHSVRLMILLLSLLMLLAGCAAPEGKENAYTSVSMTKAQKRMETEKDFILLDVRTKGEYESGHIKGALLLPNEEIGEEASPLLPDKNQLIFVYCRSGNRSKQAASKLAKQGYTNIVEIGGIRDWKGEIVTD